MRPSRVAPPPPNGATRPPRWGRMPAASNSLHGSSAQPLSVDELPRMYTDAVAVRSEQPSDKNFTRPVPLASGTPSCTSIFGGSPYVFIVQFCFRKYLCHIVNICRNQVIPTVDNFVCRCLLKALKTVRELINPNLCLCRRRRHSRMYWKMISMPTSTMPTSTTMFPSAPRCVQAAWLHHRQTAPLGHRGGEGCLPPVTRYTAAVRSHSASTSFRERTRTRSPFEANNHRIKTLLDLCPRPLVHHRVRVYPEPRRMYLLCNLVL